MATQTYVDRIAKQCIADAQSVLGKGWNHVSIEIRHGLAMASLVGIIRAQDDSADPASTLRNLDAIADAVTTQIGFGR